MRRMLSCDEVGERLGVAGQTVRQWVRKGEIPATKVGRTVRISPDVLESLEVLGRVSTAHKPEVEVKERVEFYCPYCGQRKV